MWVYGLVTALITSVIILVRKVLTNEKQVGLLKQDLENIKENVHEMKDDIKLLIRRNARVDE